MTTPLRDLSVPVVSAAIEANFLAWWRSYRCTAQAEFYDEPELFYLASGIPIPEYNGVISTRFAPGRTAREIDMRLVDVLAFYAARAVGFFWYVAPSSRPLDLARRLQAHGLAPRERLPAMAVDLTTLPEMTTRPDHIGVVPVRNAKTLRQWVEVAGAGFGEPLAVREARFTVHVGLGVDERSPVQRYLALLDGQAVGMSALFLGAGVAGIYDVATVPSARGQGIGTALTLDPLLAARARGYRVGVLEASEMGASIYRRLGFREYFAFDLYG